MDQFNNSFLPLQASATVSLRLCPLCWPQPQVKELRWSVKSRADLNDCSDSPRKPTRNSTRLCRTRNSLCELPKWVPWSTSSARMEARKMRRANSTLLSIRLVESEVRRRRWMTERNCSYSKSTKSCWREPDTSRRMRNSPFNPG